MEKTYIGQKLSQLSPGKRASGYSRVDLLDEDGKLLATAGDDTGMTLEAVHPDGDDAMAESILNRIRGYAYQPYAGEEAMLDPAAELGDGVTVGGLYSVLAGITMEFDMAGLAEIQAPGSDEIDDEYPYLSPVERKMIRQNQTTRSLIAKTAEQIRLEITDEVNGLNSAIEQTVGSIELSVSSANGSTTFKLMAGSAELSTKTLNLSVDAVNITGKLTANQIDASQLKVDAANVTGTLEAGQIDAKDLQVEAANITGQLTAEQINASQLKVDAANITGKLTASQINLSGSISWGDLNSTVQGNINSANTNASYALGAANDAADAADEAAAAAQNAMSEAAKIVAGTYYNGTFIDGTKLYSPEIYAAEFHGGQFNMYSTGTGENGALNLYAMFNGTEYHFFNTRFFGDDVIPQVILSSPDGATMRLYGDIDLDGTIRVYGDIDFSNASVDGITAVFA